MIVYADAFSSVDWDGKIVCTVFMAGCPFECWYCHNSDLIRPAKESKKDEIFKIINVSKDFIDGICVTGGEPTMHRDELVSLLEFAKDNDLRVKLDTNGYYPEVLKEVIECGLVDYVAMDVKEKFENYSCLMLREMKIDAEKLRKSVNIIMDSGVDYEFRTTVLDCSKDWIFGVAEQVKGAKKYALQRLRLGGQFIFDKKDFDSVVEYLEIEEWFDEVVVR